MWHSWKDNPPQLPDSPIEVRVPGVDARMVGYLRDLVGFATWLEWRETGIYREEFYDVTRRWL